MAIVQVVEDLSHRDTSSSFWRAVNLPREPVSNSGHEVDSRLSPRASGAPSRALSAGRDLTLHVLSSRSCPGPFCVPLVNKLNSTSFDHSPVFQSNNPPLKDWKRNILGMRRNNSRTGLQHGVILLLSGQHPVQSDSDNCTMCSTEKLWNCCQIHAEHVLQTSSKRPNPNFSPDL